MSRSSGGDLLATLGGYWFTFALLALIGSTGLPAAREFLSGLNVWSHLGLWVVAMLPGVVLLWIANSRLEGGAG
jgi:hypothetical protein